MAHQQLCHSLFSKLHVLAPNVSCVLWSCY